MRDSKYLLHIRQWDPVYSTDKKISVNIDCIRNENKSSTTNSSIVSCAGARITNKIALL